MTEAEAKTRWCPMVRLGNATPIWHNKEQPDPRFTPSYNTNCIGSACMMGCDEKGGWRGYCGLAGKP